MMDLTQVHWSEWIGGASVYGVLSYLASTIPPVQNPWGKWIIGGVQYVFANRDKAREQLK